MRFKDVGVKAVLVAGFVFLLLLFPLFVIDGVATQGARAEALVSEVGQERWPTGALAGREPLLQQPVPALRRFGKLSASQAQGPVVEGLEAVPELVEGQGPLAVTGVGPSANEVGVALSAPITATFDEDLDVSTVSESTFVVHGQLSGLITGTYSYDAPSKTLTFDPQQPFKPGETIAVTLNDGLLATDGTPLTPYQWRFTAGLTMTTAHCVGGFSDIAANLTSVRSSSVAWGDYDQDGDLDVLLTGNTGSTYVAKVYRSDNGTFSDISAGLTGVSASWVAWGDYDNDGDLDILLTGHIGSTNVAKVYRNDNGAFNDISANFPGVYHSSVAWGDYDNDGDLDILLTGHTGGTRIAKVYRNNNGTFSDISANLRAVYYSSVAWGDYDNDGDLDILLTGWDNSNSGVAKVYRNENGAFSDISANLTGVWRSSAAWGDYDNDGDLDILLTGQDNSGTRVAEVYRNENGAFSDISANLTGAWYGSVAWADYDNDGDLDILLTGQDNSDTRVAKVYRNDNGAFSDLSATLTGVWLSSVAWGDYDSDGDLDILLTGRDNNDTPVTKVYRNEECVSVTLPGGALDYTEGDAATIIDDAATVSDEDSADFDTGTLTVEYEANGTADDRLQIRDQGTGSGQIGVTTDTISFAGTQIGTFTGGSGTTPLTITFNSNSSPTSAQALVRNLTYHNVSDAPSASPRTLRMVLTDGDGDTSLPATKTINVTAVNGPPTATGPAANAVGVALTAPITATFEDDLDVSTVSSSTFVVHGQMSGLMTGTYTYESTSKTLTFDPQQPFKPGETIAVTLNDGLLATDGTPLTPYQWQFTAGLTSARCVAGFSDTSANLTGVSNSSVAWGDYDNDGDLDILLTGYNGSHVAKVYRNDNGAFSDISANLTGVNHSSVAWGDYDNDNDLDILLTGRDNSSTYVAKVYRNDLGTFSDISANLTGVNWSSVAWGDYDNDGDLDILLTGYTGGTYVAKVYRNDNSAFSDISANLTGVYDSSATWGDYDNDGDLDILLTGYNGSYVAKVYRNDNGAFSDISANLTGVYWSSVAWGDYDNDRDLDILLTGRTGSARVAKLYRNDNGVFSDISANLTGVWDSSAAWGDYDNDGDLDILLTGEDNSGTGVAKVYRNDNGTFSDLSATLTGVNASSVAWGDYDLDGDLDILLTGRDNSSTYVAKVYKNQACSIITLPGGALDYTENDPATIIDGAATVSDEDSADFDTGTLTVEYEANGTADDRLEIRHQGTGAGQIGVTTDTISFAGTQIATFTGGSGTTPLVITFDSDSSPAKAQALVRNLTYHNLSDAPSIAPRTLRMVLTDGDGSTSTPITKTINLTAVNDAPILDNSGDPTLSAIDEDVASGSNNGTLLSALIASGAGGNPISDPDSGAVEGLAVTALDTSNGAWQFDAAGGSNWSPFNAPADDSATLLAPSATIRFVPNANFNGTASITWSAWDQTSGNNGDTAVDTSPNGGTTAFSSATESATITVNPVNDSPTGGNESVTTPEDQNKRFSGSDFTFDDVDGHTFNGIRIETLETAGDLEENSVDVSAGEVIEDVTNLVFTPAANANGTAYATFTFKVRDSSGDLSANDYTMTINVTARNDAPTGGDDAVTTPEDQNKSFSGSDFTFNDVDGHTFNGIRIETIETEGDLDAYGSDVSAGDIITDVTQLLFTPEPDQNGPAYATFAFKVRDSSGAFSANDYTMTINVTAVNDDPAGGNDSITTPEDQNKSFDESDFTFDDLDGHTFNGIRIETLETEGDLEENGSDVSAGDIIEDVTTLLFKPAANANGTPYATFTFKVRDSSGAFSANDYTMTINVTARNDAPTGGDDAVTTNEDAAYTYRESDFTFDDVDGHTFNGIRIESLETAGDLEENGSDVSAGEVIEDVTTLLFTPAANANGTPYATFAFKVRDSSGAFSANDYTMTINVTARNDDPAGGNDSITATEDMTFTFGVNDFTFDDVDGHTFNGIRIETLETEGDLDAYGADLSVTDIITDVTQLVFTPEADQNGADYATFTFKVRDSSGELSADDYTMTIHVTPRNDNPTGGDDTVTTNEDAAYTYRESDFTFDDVDGHTFNGIRIESVETAGNLEAYGADVSVTNIVTDVTQLVFTPQPNQNGAAYATFTFNVRDSSGALSLDNYTMTINVTAKNDDPTGGNDSITATEDMTFTFGVNHFTFADLDGHTFNGIRIETIETEGDLDAYGSDVSAGDIITDVTQLLFTPEPDQNGPAYATFAFKVRDSSGAFSANDYTMTINVTARNDAPTGGDDAVTTNEDAAYTYRESDFTFDDVDGHTFNGIRIETIETEGDLDAYGSDVSVTDIITDVTQLVFTPQLNQNGGAYATFTFKVRDSSGELSADDYTMTINVTARNDDPTGGNDSVTATEDMTFTFGVNDFTFDDVDGHTFNGIRIETLETAGDLEAYGSNVGVTDIITDVTQLLFTPEADQNGAAYATFTFKVRDSSGALSVNDYTMTINVTALNDDPTGGDDAVTTNEDAAYTYRESDFTFADVDGHTFNGIRIESVETEGDLEENRSDVSVGEMIEDVTKLVFTPELNQNGSPYATFTFKVRDSSGAWSADVYTMTIHVIAVDDGLMGADEAITTTEDMTYTFGVNDFTFVDVDGHTFDGIRIETIETAGDLEAYGSDVSAADIITDVTQLLFTPQSDQNGTPYATFAFRLRDSSGAFSVQAYTMTINVSTVNDAPTVNDRTFMIDENAPIDSSVGSVVGSDPDEGDTLTYAIAAGNRDEDLRINPQSGQIRVNKPLDFERTPLYNLTVEVRDEDGLTDSASITIEVNNIPEAPTSVSISGPQTGDIDTDYPFVATVTPPSTELPITYTWQATGKAPIIRITNSLNHVVNLNWKINGLKTITVTAANSSGLVTGSRQIRIGNLPPEAREVTLSEITEVDEGSGFPLVPTEGTTITLGYTYYDPDGDASTEQGTLIRWTRGNQFEQQAQPRFNEQTSIPSGITIAEERWCVTVTPHDGQNYGQPSELCAYIGQVPNLVPSAEVTIPEAPVISDSLALTYTYNDPDGDPEDKARSQQRWYRNGTLQSEFNNQSVVPAQQTHEGDVWCGVVQAHDSEDFGPISPPKCTIISPPGALLPQINAEIGPEAPSDDEDLTLHTSPIGSADSREQESAPLACDDKSLHIRWFRKGLLQRNLNDSCTLSSDLTEPGEKWWATVQPYNQFGNGRLVLTKPVYILASESETDTQPVNTPPVVREIHITPATPGNNDPLFLNYEYFDADSDPEGDTLIRWYKNLQHIYHYDQMSVIPSQETSPGEVWHAVVTPNDGQEDGNQVAADSVVIAGPPGNSPPEVLIAYLSPGQPGDDEKLKLRYRYYDADGDIEAESQIRWTADRDPKAAYNNQTFIPAAATTVGEQWCAYVTPYDLKDINGQLVSENGAEVASNCVTIQKVGQNSPPEAREPHIAPARPTSRDHLELKYDYVDADGDSEAETTIFWYQNGTLQREFDNRTLVPASQIQTGPGDVWFAVVLVHDGTDYGTKETTPAVTINNAPEITEAYLSPSPPTQDQELILEDDYTDKDRDPDNSKTRWYKNGTHQPEHDDSRSISPDALTQGQKWYAVVTASDGYEETDVITTTEVTVWCREGVFWCLYLPVLLRAPQASATATPTPIPSASPTATFTPTPTPTSTPTPSIGEESNDTQQTAQGPLVSAQEYNAYPDDQNDWYYFVITETSSAELEVTTYHADGQLVVYKEYFDRDNRPQRTPVANDGRERPTMKIPNEIDPDALSNLSPGKYLVRIYSVDRYPNKQQYRLKARYGFR